MVGRSLTRPFLQLLDPDVNFFTTTEVPAAAQYFFNNSFSTNFDRVFYLMLLLVPGFNSKIVWQLTHVTSGVSKVENDFSRHRRPVIYQINS
jgi:hypothetical protein